METEKVLKLIDAGFTADEIRNMLKPAEPETAVSSSFSAAPLSPEPTAEADTPSAAEAPEEVDIMATVKSAVADQFAAMLKENQESINKIAKMAGMPSLDSVQPKSIDDIVTNFFKEV